MTFKEDPLLIKTLGRVQSLTLVVMHGLGARTTVWWDLIIAKRDVVVHHYVSHQMIYLVNRGIMGYVSLFQDFQHGFSMRLKVQHQC